MSDFEEAIIQAFKKVFPGSQQKGCFFHFVQCILRKAKQLGLFKKNENAMGAWEIITAVSVLALIKGTQSELQNTFNKLREKLQTKENLKYFEYIQNT